jgi:hypothetical protein
MIQTADEAHKALDEVAEWTYYAHTARVVHAIQILHASIARADSIKPKESSFGEQSAPV